MENQPKTLKTYKNRHGTMKNQSGAIKTNLELYRVVMGGPGGYRRLTGGSDDFSLQTNTHCLVIYLSPQTRSSRSSSLPSLNSKIRAKLHPRRQQTPFTFLARGCQVQPSDEDEKSLGNSLKDSKILRTRKSHETV